MAPEVSIHPHNMQNTKASKNQQNNYFSIIIIIIADIFRIHYVFINIFRNYKNIGVYFLITTNTCAVLDSRT